MSSGSDRDCDNENPTANPHLLKPNSAHHIALQNALHVSSIKHHVNQQLELSPPNYSHWRRLFNVTLGKFDLLNHIDGSPAFSADKTWRFLDFTVLSWIYASINPEIVKLIGSDDPSARDFWLSLEALFRDNKQARAIQLETDFRGLKQGVLPVNEYCTKLKALADGLADVGSPVSDSNLVLQTISGLNEANSVIDLRYTTKDALRCLIKCQAE